MKVPLLDLKPQMSAMREELIQEMTAVLDSTQYIMGPKVEKLEEEIAAYSGTKHALGVSSGTDALLVSLMALGVKPGDWVLVPVFSFFATAGVVARLNATPVFIDIDPVTYNLSIDKLEEFFRHASSEDIKRVRAVIPVHLYGQCADMERLDALAQRYHFAVVEDAAQALGAEAPFMGRVARSGSMGTMGCFSFFPSKNLGGMGDAGMVVTNDDEMFEKLKLMRVHGIKGEYLHEVIGGNFRMDPLQAAILSVKLKHLDGWHQARQVHAEVYYQKFQEKGLTQVSTPAAVWRDDAVKHYHVYNQFMIRVEKRAELQQHLNEHGIGNRVYYPVPFHQLECFQYLGYQTGDFPAAEAAAQQVLSIPVYQDLTEEQVNYVVDTIAAFYQNHG